MRGKMESTLDILGGSCIIGVWKVNFTFRKGGGKLDLMKNRLEEIRKDRGIRQEELALALGVSRQTIGSLETRAVQPVDHPGL